MWAIISFFAFLCVKSPVGASFYPANSTDFSKCEVYYSRYGSLYRDYFSFADAPYSNESYLLDFHFSVLAVSDAHILLAPSTTAEAGDPVYEIVIGAGGNTFCDIRRKAKGDVKQSILIKGLLSAVDIKSFWIHITTDGVVELGRDGEELAFISWTDPDPLPVKVFSFSTWRNIEAKWLFNCERTENITKAPRNLTNIEKLRRDLLTNYDPYVIPLNDSNTRLPVSMEIVLETIDVDERNSKYEFFGRFRLQWTDYKMKWNISDYGNMSNIHVFHREIWRPDLYVFNAVRDGRDFLENNVMEIYSRGSVTWTATIHSDVWCSYKNLNQWPNDVINCTLMIGFWRDCEKILFEYDELGTIQWSTYNSFWKLLDVTVETSTEKCIHKATVQLLRSPTLYNKLFFSSFLVVATCLLSIFWVSPFGNIKINLCCIVILFSTILLLAAALLLPSFPDHVPYVVLLYCYSLIAGLIATIISVVVINFTRNKQKYNVPHLLSLILTSCPMKMVLCLPNIETSEEYGKLYETRRDSSSKLQGCQQTTWILLGVAIDRLAFFIYLPLVACAIYYNYK